MPDERLIFKRTRIAPTPSGFLHIGNILSFALTVALAKNHGTKILLRIDDMDRARADKQYIQDIFDTLNFLEIPWDEGPHNVDEFEHTYSQLHRLSLYNTAIEQLRNDQKLFACTCSRQQLVKAKECDCFAKKLPLETIGACWRLKTRDNVQLTIKNYNGKDISATLPAEMKDFIVRKKDGFPAYQLTSLIDDLFYGIDLVVRGNDLWPSTFAQQELSAALGKTDFKEITFYHHPLIEASGKKLSKSAGATSIKYLRENGHKPADIYKLLPVNWE